MTNRDCAVSGIPESCRSLRDANSRASTDCIFEGCIRPCFQSIPNFVRFARSSENHQGCGPGRILGVEVCPAFAKSWSNGREIANAISGVSPFSDLWFGFAFAASNRSTGSEWPLAAAYIKAVYMVASVESTSPPAIRISLTALKLALAAAFITGVTPGFGMYASSKILLSGSVRGSPCLHA